MKVGLHVRTDGTRVCDKWLNHSGSVQILIQDDEGNNEDVFINISKTEVSIQRAGQSLLYLTEPAPPAPIVDLGVIEARPPEQRNRVTLEDLAELANRARDIV